MISSTSNVINPINGSSPLYIKLPDTSPAMYEIKLTVKDVADNVRQSRRFVLFDNSTSIHIRKDKVLQVTTAFLSEDRKVWQTHKSGMCFKWKDRYINPALHSFLKPIRPAPHGMISDAYEQNKGQLPTNGTKNVNGITAYTYSISQRNITLQRDKTVPDFTTEKLCLKPSMSDGNVFNFALVAHDFVNHTVSENITVNIDSSVPEIMNIWLVKDGQRQLYVHDNHDLSGMMLIFDALDVHSGLHEVFWTFRASDEQRLLGNGTLGVHRINVSVILIPTLKIKYLF